MSAGGARLGRYVPEAMLGQGNVTLTYRARAVEPVPASTAKIFTLKVLRPEAAGDAIEARLVDVARMLQWLSLPGIAKLVEIGERPGPLFLAFEFNEGVDLRQLRAQAVAGGGTMDARLVGLVGRKLAERLVVLHGQADGPGKHGSLSPGNVLVRPSGDVVLLDCGLDEALRNHAAWPSESWRYAAPEQLRGEAASPQSDLYAVGALMYFLCYGCPPYAAEDPAELEARIAAGPPTCEGLLPAIADVVTRLLRHASGERPRSARDVVRQLSVALLSANASVARPAAGANPALADGELGDADPAETTLLAADSGIGAALAESDEDEAETPQPFEFLPPRGPTFTDDGRGEVSADDPDVGAIFDDDDEEDEIEVGPDGTVKRRRRRRAIRLLAWTKSAFARKIFRYAWVPVGVVVMVGVVEGLLFAKSWREAREMSRQHDEAAAAERARLEAAKPKLAPAPAIPAGHLVLKVTPPGAAVWLDGKEVGSTPSTLLTQPGVHRLVITAAGYRMLRDVIDTSKGALFERDMVQAIFPLTGSVGLNVACVTEGKYPVFIDGREIGAFCPIAGVRLDPGKHMVGVFVIPENRIWTLDREVVAEHPHRVQFNY
jgi:hypothetical protein